MAERMTKGKERILYDRFVLDYLNLSEVGFSELQELLKQSSGSIDLIMHPDTLYTSDQGDKNIEINNKIENEFLVWFIELVRSRVDKLVQNEFPKPIFIFVEKNGVERFSDALEELLGNHLSKYGVVITTTENNKGRPDLELAKLTKSLNLEFNPGNSNIPVERFSYSGFVFLLKLLKISKVKLTGGFIGDKHPDYIDVYGRCLGILMTNLIFEKKKGWDIKISVSQQNTIFKDGIGWQDMLNAGIELEE